MIPHRYGSPRRSVGPAPRSPGVYAGGGGGCGVHCDAHPVLDEKSGDHTRHSLDTIADREVVQVVPNAPSTTRTCDLRFRRPLRDNQNLTEIANHDTDSAVVEDQAQVTVAQNVTHLRIDPRLQRLIDVWNDLPEPAREAISALNDLHARST